jgi:hypothetical protein
VGHRQSQLLRVPAGERHDLRQLLGRELAGAAAAVLVREHLQDLLLQLLVRDLGRYGSLQPLLGRSPPASPAPHPLLIHPE